MCLVLTMYHLHKLYKDFTQSNLEAVRIASLFTNMLSITTAEVCNSQCSTVVQVQLFYWRLEFSQIGLLMSYELSWLASGVKLTINLYVNV